MNALYMSIHVHACSMPKIICNLTVQCTVMHVGPNNTDATDATDSENARLGDDSITEEDSE